MAIQTVYSETLDVGRVGAIVNTEPHVLVSRNVEDAAVGFGKAVSQGDDDNGVHLSTTGDTAILGVTVRERSTTDDEFAVGDSARVMLKGVIWVVATVDIVAGDTAAVKLADGTFEKTADTGVIAVSNARFDSSGTAGNLVKLRLA